MPTTVRLDPRTENLLNRLARKSGRTKSQVIRDAIEMFAKSEMGGEPSTRPYDRIKHLIGIVRGGPPDLSERTGEKFTKLLLARTKR